MELTPYEQACLSLAKDIAELKRTVNTLSKAINILMQEREANIPAISIQLGEIP